jgi:hypothetical protein
MENLPDTEETARLVSDYLIALCNKRSSHIGPREAFNSDRISATLYDTAKLLLGHYARQDITTRTVASYFRKS